MAKISTEKKTERKTSFEKRVKQSALLYDNGVNLRNKIMNAESSGERARLWTESGLNAKKPYQTL